MGCRARPWRVRPSGNFPVATRKATWYSYYIPGAKGIDRAVVWIMARRPAKQVVKLSGKKSNAKNVKFPSAGSFGYRLAA